MTRTLDFESDDEETNDQAKPINWAEYSFIKPFRIILQLSGCPSLTCLFKILVSLAITSCSTERAMRLSRVWIITNRLRSTMLDDLFSALMVLSAENDLLELGNWRYNLPLCSLLICTSETTCLWLNCI